MTVTDNTPTPEPVAPAAAPAAPTTPQDYEAMYRKEVADRIAERNLYKPAQQVMNGLDEGSRAAILELAELARSGDTDAIAEWNFRTIQQVTGKDPATVIAERQAREGLTGAAPTEAPVKVPTEADIAAMVNQAVSQAQEAQRNQAMVAEQMKGFGYRLDSAVGETIIRYAVQTSCPLADAVAWYENDAATSAMERARNAAAAAAAVPGTAPVGTPAGQVPDGKVPGESDEDARRRSIMAKLTTQPTNTPG